MKQTVIISPFKGCNLEIKGLFHKAEPEVGMAAYFEIDEIIPLEKDTFGLLEWVNSNKYYLEEIKRMCIEQMENEEPDYEKD